MSRRIPRQLDPVEIRVLGALLEKEQTTPEAYPLSLNALLAACNQKTNRDPVVQLTAAAVSAALEALRQDVLVWRTEGARVEHWKQSVDRRWELEPPAKAVLTLLLLRGPQTTGQLRERTGRMHAFAGLEETEELLGRLAGHEEPLIRELPRRPGQKERRWTHLLGAGEAAQAEPAAWSRPNPDRDLSPAGAGEAASETALAALAARVERLEARLEALEEELRGSD